MVKFLWNTDSLENSNISDWNKGKVWAWGTYHKHNSNEWIYRLLKKTELIEIKNISELNDGDSVLIVDSFSEQKDSYEKKEIFYKKLSLVCPKIFLIHLGDEWNLNVSSIYNECVYVWRTIGFSNYFNSKKVKCIPVGYKSGVKQNEGIKFREFIWSFIGTPHLTSRQDLLFQLSEIKPSFIHTTSRTGESTSLSTNKMNEILSKSIFVPCPNGRNHPESYRIYEALECGCIPIVEKTYDYFDRMYPGNPFPKIGKWKEAKKIILNHNTQDTENIRKKCQLWWQELIKYYQDHIIKKIRNEN